LPRPRSSREWAAGRSLQRESADLAPSSTHPLGGVRVRRRIACPRASGAAVSQAR
jgi:hypothetical protein